MVKLSVDKALLKAKSLTKQGELAEAQKLYEAVLQAFPKNKRAQKGLAVINRSKHSTSNQTPPEQVINQLINLYNQGRLLSVIKQAQTLTEQYPEAYIIWNILGAANKGLNRISDAAKAFKKVTELNSTYADGFNNLGVILQEQGELEEAIATYNKAVLLRPDYAEAYNNLGNVLQDQGKLEEAIFTYNKALSLKSDYAEAYCNMGIALKEQKKLEEAINAFNKAVSLKPDYAEAHHNIGITLQKQGKPEQAIASYQKALALEPGLADACNNMGTTFQEQGKLEEAIDAYKKALAIKPDYAEALNNKGIALQEQGKLKDAIEAYKKVLSIKPDYAKAYYNMGIALQKHGKLKDATEAYTNALAIKPDYAEAYYNIGISLKEQGKLKDAIEAYKKVLSIKPNHAEAHYNMGNTLKEQGKLDEAIDAYKKVLAIKPDYAAAYNNMGNALRDQGKLGETIASYQKALAAKPEFADAYNNMGNTLQQQGKLDEAIDAYKKALAIKLDFAQAHRHLSSLVKYKPNNTQVTLVGKILKRTDLKKDDRCQLHYTFAKMKQDLGDLSAAFENYVEGGKLRQKLISYDFNQDKQTFEQIKTTTPKLKETSFNKPVECTPLTPIFILGMPRSGTTLVEQIISCHSQIHGAGELLFLSHIGEKLCLGLEGINSDTLLNVRNYYLKELGKVSENKPFVTDKMPQNFLYISLIFKVLPEAKVIHVKRDPAATCWSNFKHYFSAGGLGYSYDLDNTVRYYKLYQDLMKFWGKHYSRQIYHLDYDRLTIEPESETRKLIEYLELDWEAACMSPQNNKRSVRTASQRQVREKVFRGSSQAWREFEPYLNGAFDELENL